MTSRLAALTRDDLNDPQKEVYDDITGGIRGSIQGPFNAWLRSPALANSAQKLGEFCRYHTTLGPRLSEIAILITARKYRAQVEWYLHSKIAMEAGHSQATIDAMLAGGRPDFAAAPDADVEKENMVHDYATELVADGRVSDDMHARALAIFGEQGVVELVGVIGYYHLVSLTLNAFNVPLPEGVEPPFAE
ncbi:MAG: carboxymuconolactone decarboxylase family protein [Alphaproteobacteria bacterium]|jgi:4-carboxymuconolactone decarboxylase|nr:carboxymuconolactone decarboxylase family protein [Alphaproteobacteria bacterium]MBT4017147.1 carboxymuconolactone decarboxylase family protein [Alphaproteobacteria bacterium]MBT4966233.1 carboxymuconolactone decarboxylase family protein [Alphaproteobacteria bacterium]MBT5159204.1 carboxymuconolactone decarboxylase family protein [Alphaproteobacteria bacterium]MBT5918341.1 carboxymuconolactone decarboxylase family protein [Alphaproteobacteria bacterium]